MVKFDCKNGIISTNIIPDEDIVSTSIPFYLYYFWNFVKKTNNTDLINQRLIEMNYVLKRNNRDGYNVVVEQQVSAATKISKIEIVGKSRKTQDYHYLIKELLVKHFKLALIDCLKLNKYHMKYYGEKIEEHKRIIKNLINDSFSKIEIHYENQFGVPVVKLLTLPTYVSGVNLRFPDKIVFTNNTFIIDEFETSFDDENKGKFLFEKKLTEYLLNIK